MTAFLTCKDGALLVADDDPHDVNDNVDDTWNDICRTCAEEVRGRPDMPRSRPPPVCSLLVPREAIAWCRLSPRRHAAAPPPHLQALILDGACDTTVADSVYEKAVINSLVVDYEANGANKFISPDWEYGRDGYCPDW